MCNRPIVLRGANESKVHFHYGMRCTVLGKPVLHARAMHANVFSIIWLSPASGHRFHHEEEEPFFQQIVDDVQSGVSWIDVI